MSSFYNMLIPFIEGKTVLDAGSIGHSYKGRTAFKTWNFAVLAQYAASIKGFDILENEIEVARLDGHDIVFGNAETFVTPEKYQVVFAGDLIEHLSNPGLFIQCSRENLVEGGQLIVATPNTYSLAKLARVVARATNEPPCNPEHTFYFTPQTLEQLVCRHGFRLRQIIYSDMQYAQGHGSRSKRVKLFINSKISSMIPRFSQAMIAVFDRN
ncbi:class I SAM-dependent methyltransferase [Bradyrhizobium sp. CCBAU 11357]|uniref:class I SAM-dependent methyltransferase n=1 Tax=Bradyrhizobium sp. CCBAU 11357 TaxID=1630808 RepID=UPI00230306FB|nr:methyltransferase domain-containing protein [Bradyrhizobium sp. CCBAU 11357]MDA9503260.1 hypothetical protein [Bradyrhizobium sp. CCBAU 11357]